jgi:hypothetical protein
MPLNDIDAPVANPFATLASDAIPGVGKYLGAAFDSAMQHNPLQAINRTLIMRDALKTTWGISGVRERDDATTFDARKDSAAVGQRGPDITQVMVADPNARYHWMDKAAAEERLKDAGLLGRFKVSEQGANTLALELIIKANLVEQERSSVFQRRKAGFILGTAGFGAEMLASLADPVGFAANFVPVVGQAKYAAMLRAAGTSVARRAAVRAGVGAAEGIAGAALLEPLVAMAANDEMLDYALADSLYSVAFGGIFGASVHTTLGGLRDLIGGIPKQFAELPVSARKDIMHAILAAADEGKVPVLAKLASDAEFARIANASAAVDVAPPSRGLGKQYTVGDGALGKIDERLFNDQDGIGRVDLESIKTEAKRYADYSASEMPKVAKIKAGDPPPGHVRLFSDSTTAGTTGAQWSPSFVRAESLATVEAGTISMSMVDVPIASLPIEWVSTGGKLRGQGWLPEHLSKQAKQIISRDDYHAPRKQPKQPTRQEVVNAAESDIDLVEPEYLPEDIEKMASDDAMLEVETKQALAELEAKGYKLDELVTDNAIKDADVAVIRAQAVEQFTACSIGRI